jgi:Allene oxide cyclase barrel like domain
MSRTVVVTVITASALAILFAVAAWGMDRGGAPRGADSQGGRVLTVIEHASTDATTDTGAPGDTAGDVLTFANEVFDAGDRAKVGSDQGYCIRTVPRASYECNWTTLLPGGQITVEGPFYDTKNSTLAITGGTGRYRGARGSMELRSREDGAKFAFIFHIIS